MRKAQLYLCSEKNRWKNNKKWRIYLTTSYGSEFDNIVSKRDKVQDLNSHQLKLEVHGSYKKDEKITLNFEPTDDSHFINKSYLNEKLISNIKVYQILCSICLNNIVIYLRDGPFESDMRIVFFCILQKEHIGLHEKTKITLIVMDLSVPRDYLNLL